MRDLEPWRALTAGPTAQRGDRSGSGPPLACVEQPRARWRSPRRPRCRAIAPTQEAALNRRSRHASAACAGKSSASSELRLGGRQKSLRALLIKTMLTAYRLPLTAGCLLPIARLVCEEAAVTPRVTRRRAAAHAIWPQLPLKTETEPKRLGGAVRLHLGSVERRLRPAASRPHCSLSSGTERFGPRPECVVQPGALGGGASRGQGWGVVAPPRRRSSA